MKTLLSLALFSLLLNAMTHCASESKSSNSEMNSESVPPELDVENFKVVYEYFPPVEKDEDEYTSSEKFMLYQLENGLARNCTIIDYNTRSKIVRVPRPRKNKNKENGVTNSAGNSEAIASSYSNYFTATSESHANVPEYAKSSHSSSANGKTDEEAKRRAYSLLLKQLTNHFNQLYNYNSYCSEELDFIEKLLRRIYYLADCVDDGDGDYYFYQIEDELRKWKRHDRKSYDDFEDNRDNLFLGNSIELKMQVLNKQNAIDRQTELKYELDSKIYAAEKCFKSIERELNYPDGEWPANIRLAIEKWRRI